MRFSILAVVALLGIAQAAPIEDAKTPTSPSSGGVTHVNAGDYGALKIIQDLDAYFKKERNAKKMRAFYNTYIWKNGDAKGAQPKSPWYRNLPGAPGYVPPPLDSVSSDPNSETLESLARAINQKNKPLVQAYLLTKMIKSMKGTDATTASTTTAAKKTKSSRKTKAGKIFVRPAKPTVKDATDAEYWDNDSAAEMQQDMAEMDGAGIDMAALQQVAGWDN